MIDVSWLNQILQQAIQRPSGEGTPWDFKESFVLSNDPEKRGQEVSSRETVSSRDRVQELVIAKRPPR